MSVTLLAFTELLPAEMRARATAFAETISRRRTVRGFSDRPVPRDIIAECVRAAASAPGGANLQPRHFVVIGDPAIKRRLRFAAEAAEREFYSGRAPDTWLAALAPLGTGPDKPFRETAPWLIAVFAQYSVVDPQGSPRPICYPKEYVGIACGLLNAAFHDAGLATPTHAPSPMHFLNNIPGHPATGKPFLLLVTGFPAPGATVPTMALQKKITRRDRHVDFERRSQACRNFRLPPRDDSARPPVPPPARSRLHPQLLSRSPPSTMTPNRVTAVSPVIIPRFSTVEGAAPPSAV